MAKKPLLTRRYYQEQLEKQQRREKIAKSVEELKRGIEGELPPEVEYERQLEEFERQKEPWPERYNRYLNRWIIAMIILFIVAILVQIIL